MSRCGLPRAASPRAACRRALTISRPRLDFHEGAIRVTCDNGTHRVLPVAGRTIAEVHGQFGALLAELGLPAPLHGGPNEMADAVPFADDHAPRAWDADAARRIHAAFLHAERELGAFRSLYRGKSSPVQLFWGSFDFAATRFSGRGAPQHPGGVPGLPDTVTREAYSHEVISAGFWPGNAMYPHAAFYAYAYPTPPGLAEASLGGVGKWAPELGEFLLPYAEVQEAADPGARVQAFLHGTFQAAADLLDWPAGQIVGPSPSVGRPPAP